MQALKRHAVPLAIVTVVLVGVAATGAWLWSRMGEDHLLRADDPVVLALGQRVYAAHCAACHGADGQGQPNWRERGPGGLLPAPPHDASGHTWHHPDRQLFAITKHGVATVIGDPGYTSAMPAYADVLSDDEIIAALSWIKSRWPPAVRTQQERLDREARHAGR